MAREVVTLRLGEAEREAIEKGAAKQGLSFSEYLRRAALLIAFRLSENRHEEPPAAPEPEPPPTNVPPRERHVVTTYSSFADYQASSPYAWSGWRMPPGGTMREVD